MSMQSLDKARNMLCEELDEIAAHKTLDSGYLERLHEVTDTIKNIDKIKMLEEGKKSSYATWNDSERGYSDRSYDNGSYGNYANDSDGYSGRMHYVKGHYSRGENEMAEQKLQRMVDMGKMDKVTMQEVLSMI